MTKPIPRARIEQFMRLMGYEFVGAHDKRVEWPGDNDTGILTSGGNSRYHGNCASVWSVSGTLAMRRIWTSVLRRPRWRGEIGDFWQCRAGNAFTGRRIRDGETGSHPERAETLRDELTQVLWTTDLFEWSFHICPRECTPVTHRRAL